MNNSSNWWKITYDNLQRGHFHAFDFFFARSSFRSFSSSWHLAWSDLTIACSAGNLWTFSVLFSAARALLFLVTESRVDSRKAICFCPMDPTGKSSSSSSFSPGFLGSDGLLEPLASKPGALFLASA